MEAFVKWEDIKKIIDTGKTANGITKADAMKFYDMKLNKYVYNRYTNNNDPVIQKFVDSGLNPYADHRIDNSQSRKSILSGLSSGNLPKDIARVRRTFLGQ